MTDKGLEPTYKDAAYFAQLDEDEKAELYVESRSMEIADQLIAGEKIGAYDFGDVIAEVIYDHPGKTETFERMIRYMAGHAALTDDFHRAAISLRQLVRENAVTLGEIIAKGEMAAPDFGFDAPDDKGAGNV